MPILTTLQADACYRAMCELNAIVARLDAVFPVSADKCVRVTQAPGDSAGIAVYLGAYRGRIDDVELFNSQQEFAEAYGL